MPALRDLTGQTFKDVFVESRAPNRRISKRTTFVMWNCVCLLCGNHFVSKGNNLTSGNTTSCGCTNKAAVSKAQLNDLTGQRFGRWIVIERAEDAVRPNGNRKTRWLCKCDCGAVKPVLADKLVSGESTSCGCYAIEYRSERYAEDLTGQRFNHLLVLERVGNVDNNAHVAWLCLCDCGNHTIVRSASLKSQHIQSCGCKKYSINEGTISNILKIENIRFAKEYTFKDLYRFKGHPLKFDFALFDEENNLIGLIEYQGQQHYQPTINEEFGKVQREITDRMKQDYCRKNNIRLFEIKYDDNIKQKVYEILKLLNIKYGNPVPSSCEGEGLTTIP